VRKFPAFFIHPITLYLQINTSFTYQLANPKIRFVDADKNNWITNTKYNKSIIKVIAKAVADCVTDKSEFANKGVNDAITFNAEAKIYTYEN